MIEDILKALRYLGFQRARVFRLGYTGRLEPFAEVGMQLTDFWSCRPTAEDNPYVKELISNFSRRGEATLFAHRTSNPAAGDVHAKMLGKPDGMPWASVLLVSAGKSYGELAADKLAADDTWRDISEDDLEFVTFFGAQAARAIAIEEKSRMLNA